ncbi:hypothetical protein BGZ75_002313, partial [Mortierella antarctica]
TWNQTDATFPDNRCIHDLFEDQVARSLDAIAVVHHEQTLTYRELSARANGLARQLVQSGVKPGDFILVLLSRSIDLVISQIAILKAGAAYVPMDVKAPADRQAYIATDSGARLLITDEFTIVPTSFQAPIFRLRNGRAEELEQQ